MVQSEVLCRVVRIKLGNFAGTAFTIENEGVQYLITAKHLFKNAGYPSSAVIKILMKKDYLSFDVDIRYPENQKIDIAVMKLKQYQLITHIYGNKNSTDGLIMGQDVYFIGFPYEYDDFLETFPESDYPIPFIKKACLSAFLKDETNTIILDGINNPGFSGAPVCFKKINSNDKSMSIIGVVSGYRTERKPILGNNNNQIPYYVQENSGLIIVYDIKYALQVTENWN